MMKNNLLVLMLMAMGCYMWFGNASGPGAVQNADRTGSPISPGFCGVSSCHGGGNFSTDVSLVLLDGSQDTVAEYSPGEVYTLRISIASSGAEGYGFQAVALSDANDGAGDFGDAPGGTQITTIGGREYYEHSSRSTSSTFEIDWTAPAAGTGNVTFYGAGNAVNSNFQPSGDQADTSSLLVVESLSSSLRHQLAADIQLQVYPSFAQTDITSRWSPDILAKQIMINDLTGKTHFLEKIQPQSPTQLNIPVSNLHSGIYFVRLLTEEGFQTQKFVKL